MKENEMKEKWITCNIVESDDHCCTSTEDERATLEEINQLIESNLQLWLEVIKTGKE